jgi:hypothetical protein
MPTEVPETARPPRGLAAWWRRHAYILPSFLAITLIYTWFITWGTWKLFENEDHNWSFADRYFNAQADSLRHGRLDVPADTLKYEAFEVDGKCYGYFGIATAAMRVPLLWIFPDSATKWNRVLAIAGCLANVIAAYWILLTVRKLFLRPDDLTAGEKWLYTLFVWIAGLGSTTVYLSSRSFMYHEPIAWGAAFALLFYCCFLQYLIRPRVRMLTAASVLSLLAFLTRAPQAPGRCSAWGCLPW